MFRTAATVIVVAHLAVSLRPRRSALGCGRAAVGAAERLRLES